MSDIIVNTKHGHQEKLSPRPHRSHLVKPIVGNFNDIQVLVKKKVNINGQPTNLSRLA
jgi:hypothetical protein